jgi:hypothetical protein
VHRPARHKQRSDGKVQTREHGGFPIGADVMACRGGEAFAAEARSLLMDVFGRGYPPDETFLVDHDAIARYKTRVRVNMTLVRARIEAILCKAAVAAA